MKKKKKVAVAVVVVIIVAVVIVAVAEEAEEKEDGRRGMIRKRNIKSSYVSHNWGSVAVLVCLVFFSNRGDQTVYATAQIFFTVCLSQFPNLHYSESDLCNRMTNNQ